MRPGWQQTPGPPVLSGFHLEDENLASQTSSFSYFYSPQPAGSILIVRPSTVSMEMTVIGGPSWTADSTCLILNSGKGRAGDRYGEGVGNDILQSIE